MTATDNIQTYEEIKTQYPDEWILIGNLQLKDPMLQTSISRNFKSGVVLLHGTDRFEIARHAKEARVGYTDITLIYTGNIPQNQIRLDISSVCYNKKVPHRARYRTF